MTRIMTTIEKLLFAGAGLCLVLMLLHVSLEVILRLFGIVSQLQTTTFVSAWYMVARHRQLIGSCRQRPPHPWSYGLQLARDVVPNAVSI